MQLDAAVALAPPIETESPPPVSVDRRESAATTAVAPQSPPAGADWGWLPAISLTSACGLLLVALGYNGGRMGAPWTDLPFWAGLVTLFVPAAARLLSARAARRERIGLVVVFGLALYLVKVFQYPLFFTYHDELIHWRTADDILRHDRLFTPNSLIPASPLFPGLEIATGAIVDLSGLSIFHAGIVVLGAGRVVLALALYLFYERVGGSMRVAGLATLLYMSNPKLLFFDAQFSYESLALPFAILTLFAIVRRCPGADDGWAGLTVLAAIGLGATVLSHHLTSYALAAFLALWATVLLALRLRPEAGRQADPTGMAILGAVLCLGWLVYIAHLVVGYIAPHILGSLRELTALLRGELASKPLFRDPTGQATPLWERVAALTSTLLIVLGLPPGLLQLWRHHRGNAAALALAIAAIVFPATLAFRLTLAGGEPSDRAAVTLFVAVAFVLALGVARALPDRAAGRGRSALVLALLTVIFVGEIVVGAGPIWARVPGPYLVAGDSRSVEPEGIAAATWARGLLGPDNRFAADRTNRLLLGSRGGQYVVTHLNDEVDVSPLFTAPGYGETQATIVEQGRIRYVLIDRRLGQGLPRIGVYYETNEANGYRHMVPIDPAALAKFDRLLNVSLLYDSGSIQIYALGAGVREP